MMPHPCEETQFKRYFGCRKRKQDTPAASDDTFDHLWHIPIECGLSYILYLTCATCVASHLVFSPQEVEDGAEDAKHHLRQDQDGDLHVQEVVERTDLEWRNGAVHLDACLRAGVHHKTQHKLTVFQHAASEEHLIHSDGHHTAQILIIALDSDTAPEVVQVAVRKLGFDIQRQVQHIVRVLHGWVVLVI